MHQSHREYLTKDNNPGVKSGNVVVSFVFLMIRHTCNCQPTGRKWGDEQGGAGSKVVKAQPVPSPIPPSVNSRPGFAVSYTHLTLPTIYSV